MLAAGSFPKGLKPIPLAAESRVFHTQGILIGFVDRRFRGKRGMTLEKLSLYSFVNKFDDALGYDNVAGVFSNQRFCLWYFLWCWFGGILLGWL